MKTMLKDLIRASGLRIITSVVDALGLQIRPQFAQDSARVSSIIRDRESLVRVIADRRTGESLLADAARIIGHADVMEGVFRSRCASVVGARAKADEHPIDAAARLVAEADAKERRVGFGSLRFSDRSVLTVDECGWSIRHDNGYVEQISGKQAASIVSMVTTLRCEDASP